MSDLVSGGNVTGPANSFQHLPRRARLSMFAPFLLPLFLVGVGIRLLIVSAGKDLSSNVTSTSTSLVLRLINPDSGGNMGQAFSYLSFGTSLLLLYGFMVAPFFIPKLRISPRRSFVIAVSVGFVILLGSFWLKPPSNAPMAVTAWGQQQLHISDLTEYPTYQDDISQTFTVTNSEGNKVTFGLASRSTKDYVYKTYTVIDRGK